MKPVSVVEGVAAPLPRAAIDTDQIIPKQFLKRIERDGYGPFLFYDWAHDVEGELDPDFVINRPEYADAVVLVTGPSFGSGSSREHAPWALQDRGFAAIIAPSFADIFRTNAFNVGLLAIELTSETVDRLVHLAATGERFRIDLPDQTVRAGGETHHFDIDPHTKANLLAGIDRIGETLQADDAITAFERARPAYRPSLEE